MIRVFVIGLLLAPTGLFAAPTDADERRVAKRIKEAEREGYERFELDTYFDLFTRDASWTFGRRGAPDEHDYTLKTATHRTQLAGRWARGPSGKERVFFRTLEVNLSGTTGTAEAELVRHFFGGSERLGRIYQLVHKKDRWQVSAVRTWSLKVSYGPDVRVYDDEYLLSADEKAAKLINDATQAFEVRISTLVDARWYAKAYALAEAEEKRAPKSIQVLRARAQLGFTLGKFKEARSAAKALRRLDPTIQLAPGL